MIRIFILGVAAVLAAACTDQSLDTAMSDRGTSLGNVYIAPEPSSAEMITHIEGSAESLFFRASEGNVMCDSIAVITSDGETHPVFEGLIAAGGEEHIALPDEARDIGRIRFQCSTDEPLRAKLDIAVETST